MSFGRRTWDREEYAAISQSNSKNESHWPTFDEEQLKVLKQRYTDYRGLLESNLKNTRKRVLLSNISEHKKGKQFGFYCDLCDLTFKDTLQFMNHLSHKSHIIRFENLFHEPLIKDNRDNDFVSLDELRSKYQDAIKGFLISNKSVSRRAKVPKKPRLKLKNDIRPEKEESSISKVMGFNSFGSSKK